MKNNARSLPTMASLILSFPFFLAAETNSNPPPTLHQVNVAPATLSAAIRNPEMGWVMYDFSPATNPGTADSTPLADTVYTNYFSWGDLEPSQGTYNWQLIDQFIGKYPGKHIHIGIVLLDPTSRPWNGATNHGQTPAWLRDGILSPKGEGRWVRTIEGLTVANYPAYGGAWAFEPYYWTSDFLSAHHSFISALFQRYFQDPSKAGYSGALDWSQSINAIDLATYGLWGEWHSDCPWPSAQIKYNTLTTMQADYYNAMQTFGTGTNKTFPRLEQSVIGSSLSPTNAINASAPSSPTTDPSGVVNAIQKYGASMVRKFLGADPSLFFKSDEQGVVSSNIVNVPFRLEWGSCTGALVPDANGVSPFACLGGTPMTLQGAIDYALALHVSSVGWYSHAPLQQDYGNTSETLESYFQRQAGYRFYLPNIWYPSIVLQGKPFQLLSQWINMGVAKVYRPYFLQVYLVDSTEREWPMADSSPPSSSTFAPKNWPLGPMHSAYGVTSNFTVPTGMTSGWYTLKFAVVDGSGNPAMNLAISPNATTGLPVKDSSDLNTYAKYTLGSIYVQ